MQKIIVSFVLLLSVLLFSHCRQMPTESDPSIAPLPTRTLTQTEQQTVSASSTFGVSLLKAVNAGAQGQNVFISPLSASFALSMTLNGAQGETRQAMRQALQLLGIDSLAMNQSCQSLMTLLTRLDPNVRMQIANSIWTRQGFEVEPTFLNVNRTYFNAEVQTLDFDNPSTVDVINAWVSRTTNDKIKTILESIGSNIVMYLINAVYFKAPWKQQFKPEDTRDGDFNLTNNTRKSVKMMSLSNASFGYFADRDVTVADLAYGDSLYSMTILMPSSNVNLDIFIASLTAPQLQTWLQNLRPTSMRLSLPRWKFEYENKLNDELTALGMGVAFTRFADFRGINRNGRLSISEVKQKAFVEVNEEGTEAAAVTSVGVWVTNVAPPSFVANRPFLYLIRERTTGSILFIGKMTDPTVESVKH